MIGVYPEDYAQIGNLSCRSLLLVESIGRQSLSGKSSDNANANYTASLSTTRGRFKSK